MRCDICPLSDPEDICPVAEGKYGIVHKDGMLGCKHPRSWVDDMLGEVLDAPAADVEPVRHGRWGKKQGGFWEFAACSLCGEKTPTVGIIPNYCPNCGAKMELEDENGT